MKHNDDSNQFSSDAGQGFNVDTVVSFENLFAKVVFATNWRDFTQIEVVFLRISSFTSYLKYTT